MLPGLIQTAKALAKQSLPPGSVTPDMDSEMDNFVRGTTEKLFGNLGSFEGGAGNGEMPDLSSVFSNIMSMAGGGGGAFGGSDSDIHENVELDFEDYFKNTEQSVKYVAKFMDETTMQIRKKKKKVNVNIPAGIPENHTIRVQGQGHFDLKTRQCGDLVLHCKLRETSVWPMYFKRDQQDLVIRMPIENFREDSFNFQRTIPHPLGVLLDVNYKSDTHPLGFNDRTVFRIPSMGFPAFNGKSTGALIIKAFFNPEMYTYTNDNFVYTGASMKNIAGNIFHETQLATFRTSKINVKDFNFISNQDDSDDQHDDVQEEQEGQIDAPVVNEETHDETDADLEELD